MSDETIDATPKKPSNYQKGITFEKEFREFMLSKLGFDVVDHRTLIKGEVVDRPYECDLYAIKNSRWRKAIIGVLGPGQLLLILLLGILMVWAPEGSHFAEWKESTNGALAPYLGAYSHLGILVSTLPFFAVGIFLLCWLDRRQQTHVWVECHTKAKIMRKYISEVYDRCHQSRKYHKADEVWIAACCTRTVRRPS